MLLNQDQDLLADLSIAICSSYILVIFKYPPASEKSPDPVQQSEGEIGMEGPAEAFLDEINSVDSTPP